VALTRDAMGTPVWLVTDLNTDIPNILCTRETNITALGKQKVLV